MDELKKILIIEDDDFLRNLLLKKLKRVGFDVLFAVDGNDGLTAIKNEKPDLVLLDIILPGMNGFEVLKRIRTNKNYKNIPVMMLSNLGEKKDIKQGLDLGAIDYIIKAHHTLDEIIEKINKIIYK